MSKREPLDKALRKQIEDNKRMLQTLMGQLDKYEACGIDCSSYREMGQYLHGELHKIIRFVFNGEQPSPEEIAAGRDAIAPMQPEIPLPTDAMG